MKHENKMFKNESLQVDGEEYIKCTFRNCTFVYSGGKPPTLDSCSFHDGFDLAFTGAAGNTVGFMTGLYHGGFKPIIERTIENIRKNMHPGKGTGQSH